MYSRPNVSGRAALRMCHALSSLIDECRTEFFSGYIVHYLKHVCSTSPGMMLVVEDLCAPQAWIAVDAEEARTSGLDGEADAIDEDESKGVSMILAAKSMASDTGIGG
ncbi:hypothetical protein TNCV_2914301 [Trichonephila clavipes]|nr:hypothetical protein TNCV_2914301 [Trichonephila clavipes]